MRIGIVNDMFMAVEAMRRVVASSPGNQVAWIARDGAQAVELCVKDKPDLVLMDLIMPRMDGVEATRQIMAKAPCPIVVVTASIEDHSSKVFEAMGAGALDAVNTPVLEQPTPHGAMDGARPLLAKIETIRKLVGPVGGARIAGGDMRQATGATAPAVRPFLSPVTRHVSPINRPLDFKHDKLVIFGASAGGPAALAKVLRDLPGDFPAGIVIVQHVDTQFAAGLANWLADNTTLTVQVAREGDSPQAGKILIAGKAGHLVFTSPTRLGYTAQPHDCIYQPSVDVFFQSAVRHWEGIIVGVLLTGMGRDGALGLKSLRDRGCATIAQDEPTSAVFGMPRAAMEIGAASEILALDKIALRLTNMLQFQR